MRTYIHVVPNAADIVRNQSVEPVGERLREELVDWLEKNRIVGIHLDTPEHIVQVDIVRLPPNIKSVLTLWGLIYVRDEQ